MNGSVHRRSAVVAELRNAAGVVVELLANGSVHAIRHGDVLVNQVLGSEVESGIGNIYLRRRTRTGIAWFPVLGRGSGSRFRTAPDRATWEGKVDGIQYACELRLAPDVPTWFWTIEVANRAGRRVSVDAILTQDLGLAAEAAVRSSELYTSQYIDHTVLEEEGFGFLVCSRQNLPQAGAYPWIVHGCLDGAVGYLTDGFQFYGLAYRVSNVPAALERRRLPNRKYQYEFALPSLQSRPLGLRPDGTGRITFFAAYDPHHPAATGRADRRRAQAASRAFDTLPVARGEEMPHPETPGAFDAPILFPSRDLGPGDIDRHFGGERRHVEERAGVPLSFFRGRDEHVVLRAKELVAERPTGHIMRSGRDLAPSDDLLTTTAWMFGVFASQVAIGNSSFNTVISVCRNPLNVTKASGQRMFVRTERGWELLGEPSAFEMRPSSARWIYHDKRMTLVIRVEASLDAPTCRLRIDVERGGPVELLLTHHLALGGNEHAAPTRMTVDAAAGRMELRPDPDTPVGVRYPEATFIIVSPHPERIEAMGGDGPLWADGVERGAPYVVVQTKATDAFELVIAGSILSCRRARELGTLYGRAPDPDAATDTAAAFWSEVGRDLRLGGLPGDRGGELARLEDALRWFVHDAVIHYTTPHGLEQHEGAAWGVRDVCQGPVELLVATDHTERLRDLVRTVYAHQDLRSGDWPQWFMFDQYREVRAPESHADVIHWPLKALCDYVEATDDTSILDDQVPYADDGTPAATDQVESIFIHSERQIDRIEASFLPGTALVAFGGGDWEDTLQPADPEIAERMVSAWTVELAYQTLGRYRVVCERAGRMAMASRLGELCGRMRADFNRYLVPDGVVAGLAHFRPNATEYFLHPRDRRTGVSYRLLPMTRGMISGIFDSPQARRHLVLIQRHLTFPDGVRLMDRPMEYRGGTSRWFRRAESAANFGREVGLQYVHAHIRFVEAMARVGRPAEAFWGLMAACPVGIDLSVRSALPRQSNAYFSSSDAAYLDRRQASREFHRVRTGGIGVKGGWRVYSSGPGIFLNQLVSNVLGLRRSFDAMVLDPVLPRTLDGLIVDRTQAGRRVRYSYRVTGDGFAPQEVRINGRRMAGGRAEANPYRAAGLAVPWRLFESALDRDENLVEIRV